MSVFGSEVPLFKMLLSLNNPFFFKGTAGEGTGGPHAGLDMIWPLSIIMRGLTSNDSNEVKKCLQVLHDKATSNQNLMPAVIDAVKNYCTLGEIADELRMVFGEHK